MADAPVVGPAGSFRWPLDGPPRVVRRFDPPPQPWLAGHRGVDLAAEAGAVVRAAGAGTVHFAGLVAGRGVVSVTHPNGLRTTYEPLEPTVRAGQAVAAGDRIGTLAAGHADCPVAACLHWGLRRGEEYLDPLALLGLGRVRLLPLGVAAGGGAGGSSGVGALVRSGGAMSREPPDVPEAAGEPEWRARLLMGVERSVRQRAARAEHRRLLSARRKAGLQARQATRLARLERRP